MSMETLTNGFYFDLAVVVLLAAIAGILYWQQRRLRAGRELVKRAQATIERDWPTRDKRPTVKVVPGSLTAKEAFEAKYMLADLACAGCGTLLNFWATRSTSYHSPGCPHQYNPAQPRQDLAEDPPPSRLPTGTHEGDWEWPRRREQNRLLRS